jgi:TonB family protein
VKGHLGEFVVISLLLISLPSGTSGQTANAGGKKCTPPRATYSPDPPPSHYPLKDSAFVIVNILVDEKGQVREPKVTRTSGSDEFDHDVVAAVHTWRFKSALCDGKPIPAHINVQVNSRVMH